MSLRGVWLVRGRSHHEDVLFSKRFPTVERAARLSCMGSGLYYPLPSDKELCKEFLLHCSPHSDEFIADRDSVTTPFQWPVYDLCQGKLWPVVCLNQNSLLFIAVVMFTPEENRRPPLIKLPGVSAAHALLAGMADTVGTDSSTIDRTSPLMAELLQYICLAAPFGSPSETNSSNIKLQLQLRKAGTMPKDKLPAWRPAMYRGNSRLTLQIKEEIRAVQYDSNECDHMWTVFGSVIAKSEMEGHPDILISLTTPPGPTDLNNLSVHPSVHTMDWSSSYTDPSSPGGLSHCNKKLRFSGPLESFILCNYQANVPYLPIRGFYQMKGDKVVDFLVQLKLDSNVRNSFEHLEVHLPFFNKGLIDHLDNVFPSTGSVSVAASKKKVIWNIGQRLNPKTLECSLRATVVFPEFPASSGDKSSENEERKNEQTTEAPVEFLVDQNAYCEMHFKILDYTLSGCQIEPQSITTFPPVKYKISITRDFSSFNYIIWNSHGDVLSFPKTLSSSASAQTDIH